MPSARALRTTWRTRSGRARALASRLDRASAVTARSVPGEITEATVRTSTSVGPITGRGTSSTSTGPPLTGCTTCFTMFLSPPAAPGARLQVVVTPTGRGASIRQISTGASVALPNPAATGLSCTVMSTGAVAATATETAPAGPVTSAPPPTARTASPGASCQRTTISCRPRPVTSSSTRSPSPASDQRRRWAGWPGRWRNPSCTASQVMPDAPAWAASPLTRARRPARNTPHTSVESAPSTCTVLWAAVDRS